MSLMDLYNSDPVWVVRVVLFEYRSLERENDHPYNATIGFTNEWVYPTSCSYNRLTRLHRVVVP
jgi:hypothetical protein